MELQGVPKNCSEGFNADCMFFADIYNMRRYMYNKFRLGKKFINQEGGGGQKN